MNFNIAPGVVCVGIDDAYLDFFEGQYPVPNGMTYNSFVIKDDKVAVLDTADARVTDIWTDGIVEALEGRTPDYLIVQHMEPDHAANIATLLKMYPSLTVVATAPALKMLPLYNETIGDSVTTLEVKDGDVLSLGSRELKLITAPMVHWPEVVTVYDSRDGVLFSADAFGTFGTFDSQTDDWATEARRYYYNICGKYGAQVQSLLSKISRIDVRVICPLHGPVLKNDVARYIALYDKWSRYAVEEDGVYVAYASIYGHTAAVAREIARCVEASGHRAVVVDLARCDMSAALADAFRFPVIVLAASTYEAGLFTPMDQFLRRLLSKGYRDRCVALVENGSWAPVAALKMKAFIGEMKNMEILEPVVTVNGAMKKADEAAVGGLSDAIVAALER